jgi:hypothetical protein
MNAESQESRLTIRRYFKIEWLDHHIAQHQNGYELSRFSSSVREIEAMHVECRKADSVGEI